MGRKRPDRTAKRADDRALRQLVRDREKLAALSPGGSADHPIGVPSAAVIEIRARGMPCVQCEGAYRIKDHRTGGSGLRCVDVACEQCGVVRTLWFRIAPDGPN
jgi:hypothetical protein